MNDKKIILFDLDDTIFVDDAAMSESILAVAEDACKKFDIEKEKLHRAIRFRAKELWHQMPTYQYCLEIGISSTEGLWGKFSGQNKKLEELDELSEEYKNQAWHMALLDCGIDDKNFAKELAQKLPIERRKRSALFPETLEMLNLLKQDYRIGMVTNGAPSLQREKIESVNLEPFFEYIIISGEINVGKPNKEIFTCALEKFNAKKEDAIMVGNSLERDVLGAKNAEIKNIWIKREDESKDIKPDYTITNLNNLPEILGQWN